MKEQTKIDGGHAEIVPLDCYHTGTGGQHAVERNWQPCNGQRALARS